MGEELGSTIDIDRPLVSSGLSTPIFTLIGNKDFWSCHTDFRPEMSPKIGIFSFLGYLGKIESDCQNVWTCTCATVPPSVLPNFES